MVLLAWALLVWLQGAHGADTLLSGAYAYAEARIVPTGRSCSGHDEGQSERVFAVREGDTLELTCLVRGHPHPQVRWSKTPNTSSDRIHEMNLSNETLRIESVTRQQAGRYCCRANNLLKKAAVTSIRVDVHYLDPPVLMVKQNVGEAKNYYMERPMSLSCYCTSSPLSHITWLREGRVVNHDRDDGIEIYKPLFVKPETMSMVLKLRNMRHVDYANYTCVASVRGACGIANRTASFELTNKTAAPQIRVHDESLVINPGDRVFLQCDLVAGFPRPSLAWSRQDGAHLPPKSHASGGNLSLAPARRDDAGIYYCEAYNRVGDLYRRPVTIVVRTLCQGRFWITPNPYAEDGNITIGHGVNITCQVKAVPVEELTFTWLKNQRQLSSSGNVLIGTSGVDGHLGTSNLSIVNLKFTDFGTYTCVASLNNYAFQNISIDVNISSSTVAPTVTVPRDRSVVTVREGDAAELQCVVSGKPKPVLRWFRADRDAPMPDGSPYAESHDGVLRFANASRNVTGTYRCQTQRFNGFNVSPRWANVQLVVQYPPQVEPAVSEIRQAPGRPVSMRCAVLRASPARPLVYQWHRAGRGSRLLSSGQLESQNITSLSSADYGVWTCTVTNKGGSSKCLFNITGRAYAPEFYYDQEHPISTVDNTYTYQLKWSQVLPDAVDRITAYQLKYRQVGTWEWRREAVPVMRPLGPGELYSHAVRGLHRPRSYHVALTPVTQFGDGDTATFLISYRDDLTAGRHPGFPGLETLAPACRFEEGLCGYTGDPTGAFRWTRRSPAAGPTRSPNTGPAVGCENGAAGTSCAGRYMLLEPSESPRAGDWARLLSPRFNPPSRSPHVCLLFHYHLHGKHAGSLNVYYRVEGAADERVWGHSGNQGTGWHNATVNIVSVTPFQLVFEGVHGNGKEASMALDNIAVMRGRCELKPTAPSRGARGGAVGARRGHTWLVAAGSLGLLLLLLLLGR